MHSLLEISSEFIIQCVTFLINTTNFVINSRHRVQFCCRIFWNCPQYPLLASIRFRVDDFRCRATVYEIHRFHVFFLLMSCFISSCCFVEKWIPKKFIGIYCLPNKNAKDPNFISSFECFFLSEGNSAVSQNYSIDSLTHCVCSSFYSHDHESWCCISLLCNCNGCTKLSPTN